MLKSDTITKLAVALVKAQAEMGTATKTSTNPFFKSSYADLNSVREATIPVLNKHGVSVLQPTVVVEGRNYVQTTLLHESGEFLSGLTEIKAAKQNDPQAEGSGISYARRYGLQSFLNVGAVDDDGEKAMGREETNTKTTIKRSSFRRGTETKKEVEATGTITVSRPDENGSYKTEEKWD